MLFVTRIKLVNLWLMTVKRNKQNKKFSSVSTPRPPPRPQLVQLSTNSLDLRCDTRVLNFFYYGWVPFLPFRGLAVIALFTCVFPIKEKDIKIAQCPRILAWLPLILTGAIPMYINERLYRQKHTLPLSCWQDTTVKRILIRVFFIVCITL